METKFYVGQRLIAKDPCVMKNGDHEWIAALTIGKSYENMIDYGVAVIDDFGDFHSFNGEWVKCFHIDPPRTLTEWQMIKLRDHFLRGYKLASEGMDWYSLADDNLNAIESILSQPEPEKYQPKCGEPVLVREFSCDKWKPRIANGHSTLAFTPSGEGVIGWKYCIPFDPELVGKVTND